MNEKITADLATQLQPQIKAIADADNHAAEERQVLQGAQERLDQGKRDLRAAKEAVERSEVTDYKDITRSLLRGGANLGDPDPSEATIEARNRRDRLEKHLRLLEIGIQEQERVVTASESACVSARVELVAAARRIVIERLLPRISELGPELRTVALINSLGDKFSGHRLATTRDRERNVGYGRELSSRGIGIHYRDRCFAVKTGDLIEPVDVVDPLKSSESPQADKFLEDLLASADSKLKAV